MAGCVVVAANEESKSSRPRKQQGSDREVGGRTVRLRRPFGIVLPTVVRLCSDWRHLESWTGCIVVGFFAVPFSFSFAWPTGWLARV